MKKNIDFDPKPLISACSNTFTLMMVSAVCGGKFVLNKNAFEILITMQSQLKKMLKKPYEK